MNQAASHKQSISANNRLLSLDALRGFDMFWIVSGEGIIHGFANGVKQTHGLQQDAVSWQMQVTDELGFFEKLAVHASNQLHHTVWNGFTFYDLIFPLFIFIAGISMPFSYSKQLSAGADAKKKIYRSLIKRTILLLLLGIIVNGLLQWKGYEETRFASVLGRIALSCFFAALIYLNSPLRWRIVWFAGILLSYWLMMEFIPVPGFGSGVLTPDGNFAAYIDQLLLPGKMHRPTYDPEGLLSTIPAIGTALLGIFTGEFLRSKKHNQQMKTLYMLLAGILFVVIGWGWSFLFPINKDMWTSSFVLFTGGWSLLLLAIFYFIIDVKGFKTWSMPFVWLGCNSILIYMAAHGVINFMSTSEFLFGGTVQLVDAKWQEAFLWIGIAIIQFAGLYLLYKRKWFLKL
mgnify:FL=1